jgi:hypothetical protein
MPYRISLPESGQPRFRPTVYIAPASADPKDFVVLVPPIEIQGPPDTPRILGYSDRPQEAAERARERTREAIDQAVERFRTRSGNVLLIAGVLLALGVTNLFFPDPVPAIDDLALFGVGGFLLYRSFAWFQRILRRVSAEAESRETMLSVAPVENHPLLDRLATAIRDKVNPDLSEEPGDMIEAETRWLVKDLSVADMTGEGIGVGSLEALQSALTEALPIDEILRLEAKSSRRARQKLAELKRSTMQRTALSADALEVYVEFCRSVKDARNRQE